MSIKQFHIRFLNFNSSIICDSLYFNSRQELNNALITDGIQCPPICNPFTYVQFSDFMNFLLNSKNHFYFGPHNKTMIICRRRNRALIQFCYNSSSFVYSCIRSFIYSFIYSLIYLMLAAGVCWLVACIL